MRNLAARKLRFLLLLAAMTLVALASRLSEVRAAPCCSACDACLNCCDLGQSCCHQPLCNNICAHCTPGC